MRHVTIADSISIATADCQAGRRWDPTVYGDFLVNGVVEAGNPGIRDIVSRVTLTGSEWPASPS